MSSLDVRGALRRRWYLLAAGLLATAALMALAVTSVGATHEVKSSVLLLPPQVAVVDYPARETIPNPFLRLDGMDPVVSVLVTRMMSDEVSDRLLPADGTGSYQLAQDPTTQAPIIVVTASGATDAEAEQIRDRVVADMPAELQELQVHASVPADARITLTDLVADPRATGSWKGLVRILIMLAAAGVVGTVLFVGAVDGVARARAQTRRKRMVARQRLAAESRTSPDGPAPDEPAPDEPAQEEVAEAVPSLEEPDREPTMEASPEEHDPGTDVEARPSEEEPDRSPDVEPRPSEEEPDLEDEAGASPAEEEAPAEDTSTEPDGRKMSEATAV